MRKVRLFTAKLLDINANIDFVDNDFNYLNNVMRLKLGDKIEVFNGKDGDFSAEIINITKKEIDCKITSKIRDLQKRNIVTLAFAPVKNVGIDFIATKATEMGVTKFSPIITQHTIVNKINEERFHANVKEACEQCERNDFPQIIALQKLDKLLEKEKNGENILILCDETHQGSKASELLPKILATKKPSQEIIVLIGPEGGFSKEEFVKMRAMKNVFAMSLGKTILRSDTAIIAALALVGEFVG